MAEVKEECGVAAVSLPEDRPEALLVLYKMLLNMQNRGQLSAGATVYNPNRPQLIDTHKDIGTVNEVFRTSSPLRSKYVFNRYAGHRGIGHVRYATCGKSDKSFAQPFERHHGRTWKWFSFCFNGNLANYRPLRETLVASKEYHLVRNNDTEIIMHYLSKELSGTKKPAFTDVWGSLAEQFDGAYNMAFINGQGDMVASKDPWSFRPLNYTQQDDELYVASESTALTQLGLDNIKEVDSGTMLTVNNGSVEKKKYAKTPTTARCMFEWVYFSNVASVIAGKSVYLTRTKLGEELAKIEPLELHKDDTVVVPVPDTAKPSGDAYAFALGLPSREGLVRNRFVGRTFIEGDKRHDKVRNKFTVLRRIVEGKRVILVDDSVVRGTTSKAIIEYVRKVGKAKEVHLRVACPPIIAPCFYGIDMSTQGELFAPTYMKNGSFTEEGYAKLARTLGADSVIYQSVKGLIRAIGLPEKELCTACLTRIYPTEWGQKLYELVKKGTTSKGRTYELQVVKA